MKALLQQWSHLQSASAIDTPLVRWGVLAILLIMFWTLLLTPYLDWRDQQQSLIAAHAAKAARILSLQASAAQWRTAKQAHDKATVAMVNLLFPGSSYAASQATLLQIIYGYIKQFHLAVDSQRMIDAEPIQGVGQQVAIYFRVRGTMANTLGLIDAIAHHPKLLLLDHLYIGKERSGKTLLQFQANGFRLAKQ